MSNQSLEDRLLLLSLDQPDLVFSGDRASESLYALGERLRVLFAKFRVVDSSKRATILAYCLKGTAEKFLATLPAGTLADYDVLFNALNVRFPSGVSRRLELSMQLQRLTPTRDLAAYLASFQSLFEQLELEDPISQEPYVAQLLAALPRSVRPYVMSRPRETVDEVMNSVREYLSFEATVEAAARPVGQGTTGGRVPRNDSGGEQQTTTTRSGVPPSRNGHCFVCGTRGHMAKDCPQRAMADGTAKQSSTQSGSISAAKSPSPSIPVAPRTNSYNLRSKGHIGSVDDYRTLEGSMIPDADEDTNSINVITVKLDDSNFTMEVDVNGCKALALVDTGACYSVIRSDLVASGAVRTGGTPLRGAGRTQLNVIGTARTMIGFPVNDGYNCWIAEIAVVDPLTYPLIIGRDLLQRWSATVDLPSRTLVLNHHDVREPREHEQSDTHLVSSTGVRDHRTEVMLVDSTDEPADAFCVPSESDPPEECSLVDAPKPLVPLLQLYQSSFSADPMDLGTFDGVVHRIELQQETPIRSRPYRLSVKERDFLTTEIDGLLSAGVIRKSTSPWCSPVVLVPKKDGGLRMCVDYRKINACTVPDRHPIPRIDDLLMGFNGARVFSTLDLSSGYWQIRMDPDHAPLTAFSTPQGHFEFLRMPFGLVNAPATFQRAMNSIFDDVLGDFVKVYLDDVIIFSHSMEEHVEHLLVVLQRLTNVGVKLKWSKCHFGLSSIKYLGFVLSGDGMSPDPEKTRAIAEFPVPHNVRMLRGFLGLLGYYRSFVDDFANLSGPLFALLRQGVPFEWTSTHMQSFDALKHSLVHATMLSHPDFARPFQVVTDASLSGVGGVLQQTDDEGRLKPIQFYSRMLTSAERNYSSYELEGLAVKECLRAFRPYLHGSHFTLVTDCAALRSLQSLKDVNRRVLRWVLALQEFDFSVVHRAGKANLDADALSRFPPGLVAAITESEARVLELYDEDMRDKLTLEQSLDEKIQVAKESDESRYRTRDGLVYYWDGHRERLWVPSSMVDDLLTLAHNHPLSGHMGVSKVYNKLKPKYYWPNMSRVIQAFIRRCDVCQRVKTGTPVVIPKQKSVVVSQPFARVAVDVVGPYPVSSSGMKYVVVFIDLLTRFPIASALHDVTGKSIADAFITDVVAQHGVPTEIVSDQGKNLVDGVLRELTDRLGIDRIMTSIYHPQSNGVVERVNGVITRCLASYVNDRHDDWDRFLPLALLAIRSYPHTTTGISPFFAVYGREPKLPEDFLLDADGLTIEGDEDDYVSRTVRLIADAQELSHDSLLQAQNTTDDDDPPVPEHDIGTQVLIRIPVRAPARSRKFIHRWVGPYTVVERRGPVTYRCKPIHGGRSFNVHASRMKRYVRMDSSSGTPETIPDLESPLSSDGQVAPETIPVTDHREVSPSQSEDEFEVQCILNKRVETLPSGRKRIFYKVRWRGYSPAHDSWEPLENLSNSGALIGEFENS